MLRHKLVSLDNQTNNTDLTCNEISLPLELIKGSIVCLSQEVKARLKQTSCSDMNCKMKRATDNHGPTDSISSYRGSSSIYPIAHFEPLSYTNSFFANIPLPSISAEGAPPIASTVSNYSALRKYSSGTLLRSLGSFVPAFRPRIFFSPRFLVFWIIASIM